MLFAACVFLSVCLQNDSKTLWLDFDEMSTMERVGDPVTIWIQEFFIRFFYHYTDKQYLKCWALIMYY